MYGCHLYGAQKSLGSEQQEVGKGAGNKCRARYYIPYILFPPGAGIPEKIEGMPLTDVLLVNIKLLMLQELKLITEKGAEGRRKLNELFIGPERLVSSLTRPSVV